MNPVVILSGAGLSAESGLGTFRDVDGLWTRFDLAEVATPEGFARDPALVHDFYNARRANMAQARPNAAHVALARLSKMPGVTLVTQNVDNLLERAGAQGVVHMHGQLSRALCHSCGARWDAPAVMDSEAPCPACRTTAIRPDVVWFGEIPYHMDRIEKALAQADLFVSIGTSGTVYPAAGFVDLARRGGARTLELNLVASGGAFDAVREGPATKVVPDWVAEMMAG
ncbi:NAD-dependent deacetylase [Jannaschia faecimaris]|uniref:NAD-dependent protein deacylase n=1 Tax=Jannaschia faecimaris TaxID=1244108 RepID=A0A1H3MMZ8_9RHOB|nr:NAD-dependent deacylase [Jannaschia faecimaris]SDY77834.1 NAD-dependent deacetylase [Jannaschia faecimaris]